MRKLVVAAFLAFVVVGALAGPASARSSTSPRLALTARIMSFRATAGGVVGDGVLTGKLSSGTSVSRDSAPVRFSVVAKSSGGQCNVLTLRLAPLDVELLGVQVQTSYISLDVTRSRAAFWATCSVHSLKRRWYFRGPRASRAP